MIKVDYKTLLAPLTHRELRFFAFACCRSIEHLLNPHALLLLEAAENYFMGKISLEELDKALIVFYEEENQLGPGLYWSNAACAVRDVCLSVKSNRSIMVIRYAAANAVAEVEYRLRSTNHTKEACRIAEQAEIDKQLLFIDEMHNPNKEFSHPDAVQMAKTIREEKTWNLVRYLGDLLQDVGCTDQDILSHCYQEHEHCLGCWVVEMPLK